MRYRSPLIVGALCLAFSLSACATLEAGAGAGVDQPVASDDVAVASESPSPSPTADAAALAQAQAWLDAAVLPPNAVRSEDSVGSFNSFTGWPCGPVEELEGFWTIADATVSDTANWLMEHPTADLTTTAFAPVPDDPAYDSATVGYVPEPDAQEGIVYTIAKFDGGVAVRAEIAAQTESAVCPELPDGATYGAPGQG